MQEIEVKILEIDVPAVVSKLESLGAKKVFEGEIIALLFDYEDQRIRNSNATFRLRKRGETNELTFKQKYNNENAKIADEFETTVADFEKTREILLRIGLIEHPLVSKHRITYCIEDTHFEIDTFLNIPTFLEIETSSLNRIQYWVQTLGYSMEDVNNWGGNALLAHYGIETYGHKHQES